MSQRPLNVGIIGGGGGAFIVHPHQRAIFFDGTRRVTCAALHQNPELAMQYAEAWPYPITGYPDYCTMLEEEAKKPVGERMDYVLIVTPNNVHFDPAFKCLEMKFPVFCEKPLTMDVNEALSLAKSVEFQGIPFGVAHTYIGHWTSLLSRFIVRSGLLGDIRRVDAHYWQGWLAGRTEDMGVQQAEWRVDPTRAGASGCGGDIGTHAFMQLRFVTGLEVYKILYAHLSNFVPGRKLDDNFTTICQLSNGAEAHICASQIMIGHKNDLCLEVTGTRGSLVWRQEESEKVVIHFPGQPDFVYWRGEVKPNDGFLGSIPDELLSESKVPSGHAEGFHDAFARLHRAFEDDVRSWQRGGSPRFAGLRYASVDDGVKHMRFIAAAVKSSAGKTPVVIL